MNTSFPEVDRKDLSPNSLTTTEDNMVFIIAGKLGLEAIEDRILIQLDKFKSGYECKDCNETGVYAACECTRRGTFGEKENGKTCHFKDACSRQTVGEVCKTCNGTGSTLTVPETARAIPTSGIIVSIGPAVTKRKVGERILFGAHTGYFLPFKGNAKIRVMREDEPLCLIYSTDNTKQLGDFIQLEDTLT